MVESNSPAKPAIEPLGSGLAGLYHSGATSGLEDVGDLAVGDGEFADVAEVLVDRELLLLSDAQGLIELAAVLENVGLIAQGDGDLALALAGLAAELIPPSE